MPRRALLLLVVLAASCSAPTPTPRWFYSCGDPVCRGPRDEPASPACTSQAAGAACSSEGATCNPNDSCNRRLVCATSDPALAPGGCPISRAEHKRDIVYVDAAAAQRLRERALQLRLATWVYKDDATNERRLGFVIDDLGAGPEVRADGEHVDLYGYTSLAIATVQEQQRELEALRAEVAALRAEVRRRR